MPDLIDALATLGPGPTTLRTGRVTNTTPFTVTLYGLSEAQPMQRLTAYTPTYNDLVAVLVDSDGRHLVLGKVTAADPAAAQNVAARAY